MYETFDHTADLGIRLQAETLEKLLAEAGRAFFRRDFGEPRFGPLRPRRVDSHFWG